MPVTEGGHECESHVPHESYTRIVNNIINTEEISCAESYEKLLFSKTVSKHNNYLKKIRLGPSCIDSD